MYSLIIVEDDDNIRNGLVHLFPWENCGFYIAGDFSNGSQAWRFLEENPQINAVMTDIRMSVMDGLELAHRIYEQLPKIAVFFLSGFQDFEYAQQAIRYNVKDFFVKPVRHQDLMLSFLKLKEELDRQNFPSQTPALETSITNRLSAW